MTKDRSFLQTNFKLVTVSGVLVSLHILYTALADFKLLPSLFTGNLFYLLYYLKLGLIILFLLILVTSWHKLLSKVNRWDTRWNKIR